MQNRQREGSYKPAFEQSRKRLRQMSPDLISNSSLIPFDSANSCFNIESFGRKIEISYPEGQVSLRDADEKTLSLDWELILLNYLSSSRDIPLKNEWVSYRDLPQGNVFYPNIRTHVLEVLGQFFSDCNQSLLRQVLTKSGFELVESKADVAAYAKFVPRIPVLIKFWQGEEDIHSSCQILFDSTISDQIHIEDAAALCSIIKNLILIQH